MVLEIPITTRGTFFRVGHSKKLYNTICCFVSSTSNSSINTMLSVVSRLITDYLRCLLVSWLLLGSKSPVQQLQGMCRRGSAVCQLSIEVGISLGGSGNELNRRNLCWICQFHGIYFHKLERRQHLLFSQWGEIQSCTFLSTFCCRFRITSCTVAVFPVPGTPEISTR